MKYEKLDVTYITPFISTNDDLLDYNKIFKKINIIINKKEIKNVEKLIEDKKNITIYDDNDIIKKINSIDQDIIFISSCPIITNDLKIIKNEFLKDNEIIDIINMYGKTVKFIILKVPIKYNFNNFSNNIHYSEINIHNEANNKKYYYISLKTNYKPNN